MTVVPSSWAFVPIIDVLQPNQNGKPFQQGWSPQCENHPASDQTWGVLKTTAIQAGEFWDHENKQLPHELQPRPHIEVKVGDLLMTCAGPRSRCGVVCLVERTRSKLMMSGKMYRFRPNPQVMNAEFLTYFIQSRRAQVAIDGMKTGISDSGLNLTHDRFSALEVPVAPESEQRRIVAKIEELFSELDNGVEALTTARQQLKAYRQSVLKAAFEGSLTADWRTNNPGHDWTSGRFGDYFKLQGGYAFKSSDYCENGVPLIRIGDIQGDRVAPSEKTAFLPASYLEDNPSFVVTDGDILVAMSGATTGKFGIYTGQQRSLLNQRVGRVLARPSNIDIPRKLIWYFVMHSQPEILRRAYGGAQPNISSKGIEELNFSLPSSKDEMDLLVSRLEAALSRNDEIFAMISTELARCEALRQSVLRRAFSGQLVAQDSADEPASVLLERIRAEREGGVVTKRRHNKNSKKEAA